MKVKTAFVTISLFGIAAVLAAYIQRGYWAFGFEWLLPILMTGIVPIKEEST